MSRCAIVGLFVLIAAAMLGHRLLPSKKDSPEEENVEVIDLNEVLKHDKAAAAAVDEWIKSGQKFGA
jgi:hypothetical protein